jgi:O-antigen/teichoic acid export membrane protein
LLSPESFGAVQYGISLAGICAILTQPFGQHMFAKLIGSHSNDADEFARVIPQAWTYLLMLFLGSALLALPLLIGLDNLNIGVVAVFVGLTVFYTYYGIARGYLDNPRLLGAYLGSNLVQIIVTVFVYVTLSETSPIPALVIYGTSYFLPLILLQIFRPFPLKISFARPDWQVVRDLNKLAFPIFLAHAGYMIYMAIDLLLLERAVSGEDLGVYALAKNLSAVFVLIPMGVNTMILPQIARSPKSEHRRLLKQALVFQLGASAAALVFYALLYNPAVTFLFGEEYTSSPAIYLVYAAAMIITQTSSIISGALVGSGRGDQQTISVIVGTSLTVIAAFILIPLYAGAGAAAAMLIGAITGLVIYVFIGLRDFGKMETFTVQDTEL